TPRGFSRKQSSTCLTGGRPDRKCWKSELHRAKLFDRICEGSVMDIAVEKMTIAEKLVAMERLWNSLQALRDGQVQFSPPEEVAERLRGVRT
ncbi:MAG: addiction module protein, partial [Planctomycetaceae bacterium]